MYLAKKISLKGLTNWFLYIVWLYVLHHFTSYFYKASGSCAGKSSTFSFCLLMYKHQNKPIVNNPYLFLFIWLFVLQWHGFFLRALGSVWSCLLIYHAVVSTHHPYIEQYLINIILSTIFSVEHYCRNSVNRPINKSVQHIEHEWNWQLELKLFRFIMATSVSSILTWLILAIKPARYCALNFWSCISLFFNL